MTTATDWETVSPACPADAITFVYREAAAYDPAAVEKHQAALRVQKAEDAPHSSTEPLACGCPGTHARAIRHSGKPQERRPGRTGQNPAQIKRPRLSLSSPSGRYRSLVPVNAPYFDGARLLVAADCTAYAYGSFHSRFIRNHITLIGCPKLDEGDYADKLTRILQSNNIKSVTVVRMEVPAAVG